MALLFDTDFRRPADSLVLRRLDGRLFTEEEQAVLRDATVEELQAASVFVHNPDARAEARAAARELAELLHGYVVQNHEVLVPYMTHEDLLTYNRLCRTIAADADRHRPHKD